MEVGREVSAIVDDRRGEHVSNVIRMRRAALIATIAWPAFAVCDWFIVAYVHPGELLYYLSLRAIGLGVLVLGTLRIRAKKMPSPTELRLLEVGLSMSLCALVAGQALSYDGIQSPLAMGAMLVVLGRGALVAQSWRQGLIPSILISTTYGGTMLVFATFRPEIAAQLAVPATLARFALIQTFLFAAGALTVAAGHLVWNLKRQIYEQRTLGRYKLKRRIGEGGMGEVWAAHHGALRRDVAVKILRPEIGDPQVIARFEREVRATSELNHPHTIRVFDYGSTEDGLWYYVMELLDGTDLARLVGQHGPLHPARAVKVVWQACKALAEAHQRGLTHRDIKPENLFVTQVEGEGDFVKVLDFGLVKLAESAEPSPDLTTAGWAVGTPKYVSPEVAEGAPATQRSDVYGLGAVLYFALCGEPPFNHTDMRQLLLAHVSEQPLLPSAKLQRPIPDPIEAVVMRCLAKRADQRYADAGELARALEEAAAASEPIAARAPTDDPLLPGSLAAGSETWDTQLRTPAVHAGASTDDAAEVEDTVVGYRLPPF